MSGQPGAKFRLLVGGIVVGGHLGLDGVEESNKLLMPVALHVAADHRAFKDIERSEQGGGAVAPVVVRHGRPAAALQGQPLLGAIKRLNLAFLIDRQNDGVSRRRDVEPDHIVKLLGKSFVIGQLEAAPAVGSKAVWSCQIFAEPDLCVAGIATALARDRRQRRGRVF